MQLGKVTLSCRNLPLTDFFWPSVSAIAEAATRRQKMRQQLHNSKLCEKKPTLRLSSLSQY